MLNSSMVFEAVEKYGPDKLKDKEILIGLVGIKEEIAGIMLNENDTIANVLDNCDYYRPMITDTQYKKLLLLNEIIKRKPIRNLKRKILEPEDVVGILCDLIGYKDREHFVVVLLDTKNRIIKIPTISIGSLNSTVIHPREVFTEAIKYRANSCILAHNHPSHDVQPSNEDFEVTYRLIDAGKILGIKVIDHIIVGGYNYYSMRSAHIFEHIPHMFSSSTTDNSY